MHWIDKFRLAEIHREVYVAILKSWIPHGQRGEFARDSGITREYLSCLCVLDSPLAGSLPIHKRHPSPSLAEKIAGALPAPREIKLSLVENMALAHVNALDARWSSRRSIHPRLLAERLAELERTHREAVFGKNLEEVNRAYRLVRDASREIIQYVKPENYPETFAKICLYYHDVQCVLNRPDEALLYARIAQLVLESIDRIEEGSSREQRDFLELNAIRGEAVAYHNLGLDRLVPEILLHRACTTPAYRNAWAFWEPWVKRDLINALVEIPRFSIREVNRLAQGIEAICEKNGDEFMLFLAREGWLRALIKRGKFKVAQRIFREEVDRLPHLPYVGALHRALLFKSGAELAWEQHDREAWSVHLAEAVDLMRKAGLVHQISRLRRIYGPEVESVLISPDAPERRPTI